MARFRLRLKAKDALLLPPYKGSALRGGFGQVFRRIACLGTDRGFDTCLLGERCPYHYIFETPPPAGSVVLGKVSTAPQPFVIEPPLETKRVYEPGQELIFHLVLIGKALDFLPYFVYVFDELGHVGLGRGKGRYTLESIAWLDETGTAVPVYDGSRKVLTDSFHPLSLSQLAASDSGSQLLAVQAKAFATIHSELSMARALSVEAETGKCYPSRFCPDKLRPAFRMVRQEPACEFGSGHRWSKEWWRRRLPAPTPLSSVARIEGSGSGQKASTKESSGHA